MTYTSYRPGSFFLTQITGKVGFGIGVAQSLAGDASRYSHAGLVLDGDRILEAEPGGAKIGSLYEYRSAPVLVSDAPVRLAVQAGADEDEVRARVVAEAMKLVGTSYSFLDYVALAALHLHLAPAAALRKRVEDSGHLICSALVDRAYANAGVHLFDDGRLPGDVMPADLAAFAEDHSASVTL